MKNTLEKQKFIELRAKGLSFDKIAGELGISKPTLLKWSQDYKKEIANLLYFQFESTLTQFRLEKHARIESLAIILAKALDELKSRSFEELNAKELMSIVGYVSERLETEFSKIRYITDECIDPIDRIEDEMLAPKTLPFPY